MTDGWLLTAKQTGSDACANISVSWPKTGTFEDKRGLYRRMFFVIETYIKIVDSDHDTDLLNALRHINVRLTVECRLNSIMLPERIIFVSASFLMTFRPAPTKLTSRTRSFPNSEKLMSYRRCRFMRLRQTKSLGIWIFLSRTSPNVLQNLPLEAGAQV